MTDYKTKLEPVVKYLPSLVLVLMLLLVAQQLAQLSWRLWPQQATQALSAPAQVASGPVTQQRITAAQIASWSLFGKAQNAIVDNKIPTTAPETQLRLTLKGVLLSATSPSAIIAAQNADEQAYVIGDAIPGGAVLREVYQEKVILERQGRFETLSLPRRELTSKELLTTQ